MRPERVPDRMLHPRVGRHNQVAGHPRAEEHQKRCPPVADSSQLFLAKQKQSQKTRLQEKRKDSFHRECLPDHAPGASRKRGPVRAELKLHRDAGDNAQREVDSENSRPKARGAVVMFVAGSERLRLQIDKQQRQSHRQLGKDVVEGYRKRKLKTVDSNGVFHRSPLSRINRKPRDIP